MILVRVEEAKELLNAFWRVSCSNQKMGGVTPIIYSQGEGAKAPSMLSHWLFKRFSQRLSTYLIANGSALKQPLIKTL